MTELDVKIPPIVVSLLQRFGADATVTVATGAYDPTTGSVAAGSKTYKVKICPPFPYDQKLMPKDSVDEGDMMTIVAAGAWKPASKQRMSAFNETWTLLGVNTIRSGQLTAAYILHLGQ